MVYLKNFESNAAYEAAKNGLLQPNVSFCAEGNGVHYEPSPKIDGHEYVEIGGVKWATMNIGANSITDGGLYFQWGDTQGYTANQVGSGSGKKYFGWGDYKYSVNGSSTNFSKYNSTDGKTVLDASDDGARAYWGESWRMPTTEEFNILSTATTSTFVYNYKNSGMGGLLLTSKENSNIKLFFPAAKYASLGTMNPQDNMADYWSSSLNLEHVERARNMYFTDDTIYWQNDYGARYGGFMIRGVANES